MLKKPLCLLALAFALPSISSVGQTAPAIAAPSVQVIVEKDVAMQTRDGVTLRADIYRPAADSNYPVLLTRTPYCLLYTSRCV